VCYVPGALAAAGTEIEIDVRGRPVAAQVASKPLYAKEKVT
jgi:glycine cleavage system aminomethyltransferase T